jgi:hypothetical protein
MSEGEGDSNCVAVLATAAFKRKHTARSLGMRELLHELSGSDTLILKDMGNSPGPVTFSALFDRWAWRPIPNCPGRHVLAKGPVAMSPEDIVPGANGSEHVCVTARDPVIVTPLDDGGLISYRKADGTFLHTLNTREGFERKLRQLGIR